MAEKMAEMNATQMECCLVEKKVRKKVEMKAENLVQTMAFHLGILRAWTTADHLAILTVR